MPWSKSRGTDVRNYLLIKRSGVVQGKKALNQEGGPNEYQGKGGITEDASITEELSNRSPFGEKT